MHPQTKSTLMIMVVLTVGGLNAGCDHQLRGGTSKAVPRTLHVADDSPRVDKLSTAPSIVRHSVDPRCFGPSQEDNTEVIACPRLAQLH